MPWALIKDRDDWNKHCTEVTASHNMTAAQVAWGNGPMEYPCLAATLVSPPVPGGLAKLTTAYVYKADALALLHAAGVAVQAPGRDALSPTQDNFNRWLSAQVLTIIHFLVETRICKPGQFEEKLLEQLELVDAYKKEKTDELRERLGRAGAAVLDRLEPPGQ